MAGAEPGYLDYVKAAFHLKVSVRGLGAMPVNKFILAGFTILGIGHPGFWLLGLGYEIAYLLFLSGSPRFQKLIKGTWMEKDKQVWDQKEFEILSRLDNKARVRYLQLVEKSKTIVQTEEGGEGASTGLIDLKSEGLNQLLMIFLKLLRLQTRIRNTLARTNRDELISDIESIKQKMAAEPETSPVRRALQGTLDIQQTRLENLDKSLENLKFTEAEMERIEKQVSLTAEEVAVSKDPEQWSAALDGVVKSIQGTNKWMADHSELFESIDVAPTPLPVSQTIQPPITAPRHKQ